MSLINVSSYSFFYFLGIFDDAKISLQSHIKYWGYQETKEQYIAVLKQADVVVSTANHEFFGVSMYVKYDRQNHFSHV